MLRRFLFGLGLLSGLGTASYAQTAPKSMKVEYLSPDRKPAVGKAPGLKTKLLSDNNGVKTYALIFAKGDEVLSGLTDFVQQNNVQSAHFTAIGSFKDGVKFAWYDTPRQQYKTYTVQEQVELISLIGDVSQDEGKPVVHAHVSIGFPDGTVRGGHFFEGHVFPTVELLLTVEPTPLYKKPDPAVGISVIDPDLKK